MKKIALFASGSGTNVENIVNYFKDNVNIEVTLVLCNKPDAFVIQRAKNLRIHCEIFNREDFYHSANVLNRLRESGIDFIVLAGFLWLVPKNLTTEYPNRIINIHPALLPKYGGKGMYGKRVHEAVVENGETETGITIHYINEKYDEGNIIFQAKCEVNSTDKAEDVAEKVHALEYEHYPKVIERLLEG
ncbi:MAG: phosphoribosylglycinamide formyltransferase [Bacteroidales bacterium]|nr:phosphoribosylglycinamide formyltransferase [Bacteroidales bacterium]